MLEHTQHQSTVKALRMCLCAPLSSTLDLMIFKGMCDNYVTFFRQLGALQNLALKSENLKNVTQLCNTRILGQPAIYDRPLEPKHMLSIFFHVSSVLIAFRATPKR